MNYLLYVEHAAENLQFFLWIRDYIVRFSELPESLKILSPPVDVEKLEVEPPKTPLTPKSASKNTAIIFKGTDFDAPQVTTLEVSCDSFESPLPSPAGEKPASITPWDDGTTTLSGSRRTDTRQAVANAFESADVKWQPCQYGSSSCILIT